MSNYLAIPDEEKATGIIWVVYPVVKGKEYWYKMYGVAEVQIRQTLN